MSGLGLYRASMMLRAETDSLFCSISAGKKKEICTNFRAVVVAFELVEAQLACEYMIQEDGDAKH